MLSKEKVFEELKKVFDPELGVSVVDLGLIYDVKVKDSKVTIIATLTNPFCPLGDLIVRDIEDAVMNIKEASDVEVKLTFDPPWDVSKISKEAKERLGI